MCSSGMETRVSCYRIIISLQSPSTSAALRQRTHTPASSWTTTLNHDPCVQAQGPVYTCFYLLDHQKTHFVMSWRQDLRLVQDPRLDFSALFCCTLQTSESPFPQIRLDPIRSFKLTLCEVLICVKKPQKHLLIWPT